MKKFIMGTIFGILLCVITYVVADTINSNEVLFDNSNIDSPRDNVQDVLNDMYRIIGRIGPGFKLLVNSPKGLSANIIAGLYRYQGESVDNYICFGTTDKDDCIGDTDKYMYRIIGINTSGQMKLIKKEALNESYQWYVQKIVIDWPDTTLYSGLNDSFFLTNTTYIPDNSWNSKIAIGTWPYGVIGSIDLSPSELAYNENQLPTIQSKIGLMNISDYFYGLPGGNNCKSSGNTCKKSWLFLGNNDPNSPSSYEWLMVRYKYDTSMAYEIHSNGDVDTYQTWVINSKSVRPVFYLKAGETIASGSGTITDPYVLN